MAGRCRRSSNGEFCPTPKAARGETIAGVSLVKGSHVGAAVRSVGKSRVRHSAVFAERLLAKSGTILPWAGQLGQPS